VHPDAESVAAVTAGRLLAALVQAQSRSPRGEADVVLTGGGVGTGILRALAVAPGRDAVDWGSVEFWWGDERWVPEGDPDRNAGQARAALLDQLPVDPARVHAMGAERPGATQDADAAAYAEALAARAAARGDAGGVPVFDVLMLGLGPEGHVASLFPHTAGVQEQELTVVPVLGCPKPPPLRISLTLPAIRTAREVWIVSAGAEKADAVRRGLAGATPVDLPAAGARGRLATYWLVDRAAASR
jgi:6-phosphogluconolactonase